MNSSSALAPHEVAEKVYALNQQLAAVNRRLEPLGDDALRTVLHDRGEASLARQVAMGELIRRVGRPKHRRPAAFAELLSGLIDDPDPEVARVALDYCPILDDALRERVRAQLDSTHSRVKGAAAQALAKIQDEAALARALQWFAGDDEGHRNLAIQVLRWFGTEDARAVLTKAFDEGGRNHEDRLVIATALAEHGDPKVRAFLHDTARAASGAWSSMAATWLYFASPEEGLRLFLHILDRGDDEARQSAVSQISGFNRSPHAWTADGINDARMWVTEQLAAIERGEAAAPRKARHGG